MTLKNKQLILVNILSRMQQELIATNMLDKDGYPLPLLKDIKTRVNKDAISVYKIIGLQLLKIEYKQPNNLDEELKKSNVLLRKTIESKIPMSNYLLAIFMYRLYLQEIEEDTKIKNIFLKKVETVINYFLKSTTENEKQDIKNTNRLASNAFRIFNNENQVELKDTWSA